MLSEGCMIPSLNSRVVYVMGLPLLIAVGAATTILAPMLLDAASFTRFALLNSVFTYLSEFDLGLARLSDRLLPCQTADEALLSVGSLLFARYCVAVSLLALGSVFMSDPLMLVAVTGGIALLLANGPLSFYRARANTRAFVMAALLMQFGATLPRLMGLLVDGVRGSMIGIGVWSGVACIILNVPFVSTVRFRYAELPRLIARSVPLFLYNAAWLLYLFANRWFSWWLSDSASDAGLFAFGANLTVVAVGIVMSLSQPYYPRHLATPNPASLARELYVLVFIGVACWFVGDFFCRFALGAVFPHFTVAASATSALLVSGIPLGLSAWLVPLAIARSTRPSEVVIFPVCLVLMYGLMVAFNARMGIDGQAWACLPPAMVLYGGQLALVAHKGLLYRRDAVALWFVCLVVAALGTLIWCVTFR